MKYLIIEREGMELALLFADYIQHREAARGLVDAKLISAGFCKLSPSSDSEPVLNVSCWGRSDSLNLSSRPQQDAAAILFTLTLPSLRERPPLFTDEPQLQLTASHQGNEELTIRMRRASSIALELEHLAKGTTAPEPGI